MTLGFRFKTEAST